MAAIRYLGLVWGIFGSPTQNAWLVSITQGSDKPGKPGIVREFCKPGKVREK